MDSILPGAKQFIGVLRAFHTDGLKWALHMLSTFQNWTVLDD